MFLILSYIAVIPAIRLIFFLITFLFGTLSYSQSKEKKKEKTEKNIEKRPVKLSLLSNYYDQDGDRSAVNGGVGSQKLESFAQEAHIFLPVNNLSGVNAKMGVDHFTSASLATIDKYRSEASGGASGVSGDETRMYGTLSADIVTNKNVTLSPSVGFSKEYDVQSVNGGLAFSKILPKSDMQYTSSLGLVLDKWMVVHPGEFRSNGLDAASGASSASVTGYATPLVYSGAGIEKDGQQYPVDYRKSLAFINSLAFNINRRMNGSIAVDLLGQTGLLSTPFHRVYFNDGVTDEYQKEVRIENLPRERYKAAVSGHFNYFVNDLFILRTYARLYADTWGIKAVTLNFELPVRLSREVTLSPFYRLHLQDGTKYYHNYGQAIYTPGSYYTSDMDLASFSAQRSGAAIRYTPLKSFASLKDIGIRYGYYNRLDGLTANIATLEINFEF